MSGTTPPPLVPEMPTDPSDETARTADLRADGGDHRPEATFGAPLVPDWS